MSRVSAIKRRRDLEAGYHFSYLSQLFSKTSVHISGIFRWIDRRKVIRARTRPFCGSKREEDNDGKKHIENNKNGYINYIFENIAKHDNL